MDLLKMVQEDGTYDFSGNRLNFTTGYMVGIKGFVLKEPILTDDLTNQLYRWYNEVALRLQLTTCFGVWRDTGLIYLDVSVHVSDKILALELGKEFHQIAIWDCAKGSEIVL